jgi:hypothetical protein
MTMSKFWFLFAFTLILFAFGCNDSTSDDLLPDGDTESDLESDGDSVGDGDADFDSETEADLEFTERTCDLPTWKLDATPDALNEHCGKVKVAECARAFDDCPDLWLYSNEYGDLASCQDEAPTDLCGSPNWDSYYLDEAKAEQCLGAIPTAACDEFDQEAGIEPCWHVERPVPPDPALCSFLCIGTNLGSYSVEASRFLGDYVALFCVCAEAGETLDLRFLRGTGDGHTRLFLYDPTGNLTYSADIERLSIEAAETGTYVVMAAQMTGAFKGDTQPVTMSVK